MSVYLYVYYVRVTDLIIMFKDVFQVQRFEGLIWC